MDIEDDESGIYAFRNLATCLSAYRKSNGTGWPDGDEIPWELTTTEPTLEEAAHAEQLFTQWLQPNDDWEYLLGRLPYQRTADLHVALQFATESKLKEQLYLKFDPMIRGEFASQLSRLPCAWAREFLTTWRAELTDYEEELSAFSEHCAAALRTAGIPAHGKWKKVFLEGRAEPLDTQAVFPRRHEPRFRDELITRVQALVVPPLGGG